MKLILRLLLLFILFINIQKLSYAQELTKEDKPTYKKALAFFNNEDFEEARPVWLLLCDKYPNNFEINYYVGACYLNTQYRKIEAIPYLLKAIEHGEEILPAIVHKDLADLYHSNYNFDLAIHHYKRFLKLASADDDLIPECEHMIEVCKMAKELITDTLNLTIHKLDTPINTRNSEFSPYLSTDKSILYYTSRKFYTDEELQHLDDKDTLEVIYRSVLVDNKWGVPQMISINYIQPLSNLSIAGMSADGETIYINGYDGVSQDIYLGKLNQNNVLDLKKLPEPVNSEYYEGRMTITPDENTIYFVSDRPGSLGGKDIFKVTKEIDGNWTEPVNMGNNINTQYDENSPFLHPSGKIFYFTSKGHNTLGGYDIFSVLLDHDEVMFPENLGFPINTTGDDNNFTLSADGKSGYFSTSFGNKYNTFDIYQVEMNLNIPFTLVKGHIFIDNNRQEIKAHIKVVDNETGIKQRYIYNPNPITGRFLMIFPPGKNYKIIIEAEGFIPKSINVYIPDQTEFYELFQNIYLTKIVSGDNKVGEEIKIENLFTNTTQDTVSKKDYSLLFDAINTIINKTDSLDQHKIETRGFEVTVTSDSVSNKKYISLFEDLDNAFDLGNKDLLNEVQSNTIIPDRFNQTYFLSDTNNVQYLDQQIIGEDTIFTTPSVSAFNIIPAEILHRNELILQNNEKNDTVQKMKSAIIATAAATITPAMIRKSGPDQRKVIMNKVLYFNSAQSEPIGDNQDLYLELAGLLVNNNAIGILLKGYADTRGAYEANTKLAYNRTQNVLKSLTDLGVDAQKIIIKVVGEQGMVAEENEEDQANNRRVELEIFEYIMN